MYTLDRKHSVDNFIKGVFGVMRIIYRHWENCILSLFYLNVEVTWKTIFRSHLTFGKKKNTEKPTFFFAAAGTTKSNRPSVSYAISSISPL